MSNVYCIKTKKKISKESEKSTPKDRGRQGYSLKMRDYILKVIFECPRGHLFSEEWHADKIEEYGAFDCLEHSTITNENIICPECLKISNKKKN